MSGRNGHSATSARHTMTFENRRWVPDRMCFVVVVVGVLCVCVSTKCIFWGNIFGKFVHQKKKTRQIRAKHYDLIICLLGTFVCPSQGSPSPIGGLVLIQNIQR